MRTLLYIAGAFFVSSVTSTLDTRDTNELNVLFRQARANGTVVIDVVDETMTKSFGQSCSKKLNTGAFAKNVIKFNIDEDGSGNFTYGGVVYPVPADEDATAEIECDLTTSEDFIFVSCPIPWEGSLPVSTGVPFGSTENCFAEFEEIFEDLDLGAAEMSDEDLVAFDTAEDEQCGDDGDQCPSSVLNEKRQTQCYYSETSQACPKKRPHQQNKHRQMTDAIDCHKGEHGCGVARRSFKSHTETWSVSGALKEWVSGSYTVTEKKGTGNNYHCGNIPKHHDVVCLWHVTPFTRYRARNKNLQSCSWGSDVSYSNCMWVRSPNKKGARVPWHCHHGKRHCKRQGDHWWGKIRKGGPP